MQPVSQPAVAGNVSAQIASTRPPAERAEQLLAHALRAFGSLATFPVDALMDAILALLAGRGGHAVAPADAARLVRVYQVLAWYAEIDGSDGSMSEERLAELTRDIDARLRGACRPLEGPTCCGGDLWREPKSSRTTDPAPPPEHREDGGDLEITATEAPDLPPTLPEGAVNRARSDRPGGSAAEACHG